MPEDMPDRMPEGMPDRMPDKMSDRMPEDMPDKVPECLPDRMPEDMPDRMPEDMPDKMPEYMPDRMPEGMPDRMSDRMPEGMSDKVPECLPEHMPEDCPDRMPEDMPDKMPEDMPDRMPEGMPGRMPEGMSDKVPECLPEHMPEDLPDRMPEDMPDKMPEDMSDRMPEDLPVTKRINVMVGITRSKKNPKVFPTYFLYLPILSNIRLISIFDRTEHNSPKLGLNQKSSEIWDSAVHTSIFTSLHRVFYHGAKASRGRQFFKLHRRPENPESGEAWQCDISHCENVIRSNPTANSSKHRHGNVRQIRMAVKMNNFMYFASPIFGW